MSANERRPPLPEGPFLVVGLARSGRAAAAMLAERGEKVIGVDSGRPEVSELERAGVEVALADDGTAHLDGVGCVVKSPGVPREAPVVAAARGRGIEVVGELELAWRLLELPFVAVTGTNGKTTVTELAGHVWRTAGRPVEVAGNVGTPLSSLVGSAAAGVTVVCECSSFQLEDASAFAPETAVLLNVTPDHLDRHGTLEDYVEAKLAIFARQRRGDLAVVSADDAVTAAAKIPGSAARMRFGLDAAADATVADGWLVVGEDRLIEVADLALPGAHNLQNSLAVALVAREAGIDAAPLREALAGFPGVAHRLERVAEIGGVTMVNDSKATNVAAAAAALRSFDGGVRAILGGSLKGEAGFEGLVDPVRERCRGCYLIGEAAPLLARALAPSGVPVTECGDLEQAVERALSEAAPGEVVLMAPACASFDSYSSYEQRGEHFRSIAGALA